MDQYTDLETLSQCALNNMTVVRPVLDKIADWGWTPGVRPEATAPVWRMDAFRDRFLSTFSS